MARYVVTSHDESEVVLRQQFMPGLLTEVRIQRDKIASVRKTAMGWVFVETTGSARYQIMPGVKSAQRRLTFDAFGVTV